jgi:peptide/nickel transport system permease protein
VVSASAVLTFFLIRLVPGDVVDIALGQFNDPAVAAVLRRSWGLDQPIHLQFLEWIRGILRGDLGLSFRTGRPVTAEILQRLPATLELTSAALILSLVVAIPAGVLSATHRNSSLDFAVRLVSLGGISMPHFWLGILLILLFAVELRVLPSLGYAPLSDGVVRSLRFLIMPAVTLGYSMAAALMRMTRSAMLEVLGKDYVRTARAKGLKEARVIYIHALRNALFPVVTVIGINVGRMLGGAVVVEEVFSWPGLGSMMVTAIFQRDYPIVQGIVIVLALLFVCVNLAVDVLYSYLDPRLRHP